MEHQLAMQLRERNGGEGLSNKRAPSSQSEVDA